MAYMSQENKKSIAASVKPILKKYGIKGSFGVHNHSTLVLNITEGPIDFINNVNGLARKDQFFVPAKDYTSVNPYWYKEQFSGKALAFLNEVMPLLNKGNHDNSDIQTDYFDVGWYIDVNIGKWNKPYVLVK